MQFIHSLVRSGQMGLPQSSKVSGRCQRVKCVMHSAFLKDASLGMEDFGGRPGQQLSIDSRFPDLGRKGKHLES